MSGDERTTTVGDNSGAQYADAFADLQKRLDAFIEGAEVWAKRKPEEIDDDLSKRGNDFLAGVALLAKDAETNRKGEKQPHLDAGRLIDEKWNALGEKASKLADVVKPLLDAFLKRKKAEAERIAQEAEERRKAAEAEEAATRAKAAEATSVREKLELAERADAAAERALLAQNDAKQASAPVKLASATGLTTNRTLRKVTTPEITSLPALFNHYRDEQALIDLLLQLAARDLRAAPTIKGKKQRPTIPGINWIEKEGL